MARAHLTEIVIRAIQPPLNGQVTYWDTTTRAFGVRLSKGGTRTWVVMRGRTRQLETIGHYPDMPLANARAEAKRRLAERRQPRVSDHSFASALDLFVAMHCAKRNKPSTAKETERLLRKHFLPKFRSRSLADTTHEQIADIIDHITNATANHAFAAIRTFFRWCVRRRFIPHSPCDGMVMPDRPVVRDRVLTDPELVSIWRAAERYGYPFGTIVQLLILTGQRRSEIAMLKWEYINQEHRIITLPSEIVKNNRRHTFPYGALVAHILDCIPGRTGFLFPARGSDNRPFSGWASSKANLETLPPIRPWTLHDLRRTFATNLAALKFPPYVTEKLLNHVTGTISGVAAIYNRFQYSDEMRAAIEAWEARLTFLLES
jgi:integrase